MMMTSDPIADMLTRIRNANTAKHDTVDIPSSKMKNAIAEILFNEGYITKYEIIEDGNFKTIRVTLKYGADKNEKIITGIKRISKPGLRVYALVENFGVRCCLIFIDFLAIKVSSCYLANGMLNCVSNSRASSSVLAVVTKMISIPLTLSTLSYSISGKINCSLIPSA